MTWVVVSDPVPGGATILGSGLGRDSQIATRGEKRSGSAWPAYEERSFEAFRTYYEYLPRGKHVVEYTVRLNNPGPLRAAADARRGDVRAGEVRRVAERGRSRSRREAALRSIGGRCALVALRASRPALPRTRCRRSPRCKAAHRPSDVTLVDRHGTPIQTVRVDKTVRRLRVGAARRDVAGARCTAIVLSEDQRFWEHGGVDWQAAATSAWGNLWNTRTRGASTLTMQLAGLHRRRPRAPERRAQRRPEARPGGDRDAARARPGRRARSSRPISTRCRIAARSSASRRSRRRCSASTRAASTRTRRRSPPRWCAPEREARPTSRERACGVLQAAAPRLRRRHGARRDRRSRGAAAMPLGEQLAPHFARQALDPARARRAQAQPARRTPAALRGRRSCAASSPSSPAANVEDGAVVVLDNASGDVLAWVGSSGDLSGAARGRRRARAAPAGLDAEAVRLRAGVREAADHAGDADRRFAGADRHRQRPLPAAELRPRTSRASSARARRSARASTCRRCASARWSAPTRCSRACNALGLALPESAGCYGASLALGSADVTLLALTNAYRALANGGRYAPVALGARQRAAGAVARRRRRPPTFLVTDILADNNARARTFGWPARSRRAASRRSRPAPARTCATTGASASPTRYTIGVWVGNASGAAMHDVSGVSGAAPVWQAIAALSARGRAVAAAAAPGRRRRAARRVRRDSASPRATSSSSPARERALQRATGEVARGRALRHRQPARRQHLRDRSRHAAGRAAHHLRRRARHLASRRQRARRRRAAALGAVAGAPSARARRPRPARRCRACAFEVRGAGVRNPREASR